MAIGAPGAVLAVGSGPLAAPRSIVREKSTGASRPPLGASYPKPEAAAPCGEVGAGPGEGNARAWGPGSSGLDALGTSQDSGAAAGPYGGRGDVQVEGKPQS